MDLSMEGVSHYGIVAPTSKCNERMNRQVKANAQNGGN
jgi:hypothetical protein